MCELITSVAFTVVSSHNSPPFDLVTGQFQLETEFGIY
uniref:Uncharacterized protein n=1 Tax=Arundo donax TaxID=35708 RepID=A0A0A8Z854_ARUDO